MSQLWRTVAIVAVLVASFRPGFADENNSAERALSLEEAIALLHANNQDLALARTNVKGAEGDLTAAAQKQNPTLSLGTSMYAAPSGVPESGASYRLHNYTDYNVGISVLLERGSKRELRTSAANKGLEAARADVKTVDAALRLQLSGVYYGLADAERKEKIAQEYAELYDNSTKAMRLRESTGDIAAIDLARAEVEAQQAYMQLEAARAARRSAQWDMTRILGFGNDPRPLKTTVEWNLESKFTPQKPAAIDLNKLIEQRASVVAAKARVEQARENIHLAQALRKNDVTVGVAFDHEPPGNNISQNNVSLNLSFPLQVSHQYGGEIQKAYAQLESAEADLQRIRNDTLTEIARARDDVTSAANKIERLQSDIIPRAREAVQAAEFAYDHGAISLTDLMDARRALQSLLLDSVDVYADYYKALQVWQIESTNESAS